MGTLRYYFQTASTGLGIALYSQSSGRGSTILDSVFDTQGSDVNFYGNVTISKNLTVLTPGNVVPPDYVFEPDYDLASLADIEAFTQEHKHLPEVPSAAEIAKGGLDLASMNLTLLKKVEELTLHAIAQAKRIEAQNERIQALENRVQLP